MMKITTSKNKDTNITTSSSKVNPGVGTTMTENQSGARLWPLRRVRGTLSQPPSKSLQQQQQQEPQQETNTSSRNEKSPFRIRFRRQPASSKSDLTTSLGASSRQQEEVERKKEKRPTPSSTSCPQTPKAQQVVPKIPKVLTRETANEDGNSRAKAQSGSSGPNRTCLPISQEEKVATVRSKTATNEASLVASSLSSLSVASARDPDWSPPLDTHSGLVVDDHPLGIMGVETEEEAKEADQLGLDGDTKNNKNTNNNTSNSSNVSLVDPHSWTSHSSTKSAKRRAGKTDIIKSSSCTVATAAESVSTKSWCSSPSVVGHHYIMALQQQQRQQQQPQEDIEVDEENEEDAAMDAAAAKELLSRMWRDLKAITKNEPQLEQLLQPPRPITTSHEDLSAHKDTRHCTNKTTTQKKKKKQHSTCFIQSPASWSSVASTAETLSMTSWSSSSSNYHSEFAMTSSNEERSNASSGLKLNKSRDSIAVDAVVHMDRQASEVDEDDDEEEQQTEDPDWSHCALSSHGSFQTKSDNMSVLTLSSVVERAFPLFCSASASGHSSHSNVLSNHSPAWADQQQQPPHPPNLESEPKYHHNDHNDVNGKDNASQKSNSRATDQTTTKAILKSSSCSAVSATSAKSRFSKTTRLSYHSKRSKSTGAVSHTTSSHSSSVSSFVVDSEEDAFSDYKEHPLLPIYRTLAKHLTKFYGGGVHDKKDNDDVVSTSSASGGGTALSAFGLYFGADVIAPPVVNKTDGRMNE